jgi:predicted DNA-binding antitoxin AbrB/MazE fold protein
MKTIHAIYENGVFRPLDPVDLPEHARVRVEPDEPINDLVVGDDEINKILSRRYRSGHSDTAARHDEHQP